MKRFIGIDPGDRWTGVAQLIIEKEHTTVGTFVIDGANRRLDEIVHIALLARPAYTVAEEYRARPIGHQRFNASLTPRLLGALEYRTYQLNGTWRTIPAGAPQGLWSYPIGGLIKMWKERWPRTNDTRWEHALSAWRVLCASIMREQPHLHTLIGKAKHTVGHYATMEFDEHIPSNVDLIAPFASWAR